MDASLIKTDGCGECITPENEVNFSLDEMQSYVGGLIQIVELGNGMIMVVNEDGKWMGLDINPIATFVAHECNAIHPNDYIVGDAIVCDTSMVK